jgi:MarR family transcriptional regulator, organic hydroperoxide resistance regulator
VLRVELYSVESSWHYRGVMEVDLVRLFRDLVRLETELWNRVEARVQHVHGLPLAWLEVMQVVSATGDCRVLDIAKALSITVGGASKVVDKVEAAGWCRRQPNPTDGRSNLIQLTDTGEGLLEAANVTFASALATDVAAGAPATELAQLSATLRRLRHHLSTAAPVHLAVRR